MHLLLISERVLAPNPINPLSLHIMGDKSSGKSSFYSIYRAKTADKNISYILIHALNKNKIQVYNKICNVLALKNCSTIGAKVNFSKAVIFVDDLGLAINDNSQ